MLTISLIKQQNETLRRDGVHHPFDVQVTGCEFICLQFLLTTYHRADTHQGTGTCREQDQ